MLKIAQSSLIILLVGNMLLLFAEDTLSVPIIKFGERNITSNVAISHDGK